MDGRTRWTYWSRPSGGACLNGMNLASLHSHREGLAVCFRTHCNAGETALQQRHQAGAPVADYEEEQEGNGDVVLVVDGVVDGQREIGSDEQLEPWHPSQTLAVFGGGDFVLF